METPQEIKKLEIGLGIRINRVEPEELWQEISDREKKRAYYAISSANTVVGLFFCKIDVSISTFPSRFPKLETLVVNSGNLKDLSPLASLTALTLLSLDNNQIQDVSPLASLTTLTQLWLHNNQIQDVSPLASLTALTRLGLYTNQIQDVSPLASLTALPVLGLGNNQIQDVSSLASLTALTRLWLHNNQIQDVSPLASLTALAKLWLDTNQIQDVSPLASLTALTRLGLDNNQIQDVSPLASLTVLTGLWLSNNQIQDVSPLASLTALTELWLDNNQIQDVSPLVPLFHTDLACFLHSNPITRPPAEIVAQGPGAICAWFDAQSGTLRQLNEVKVLLVGAGSAGKTSLVKALRGDPFDLHESQTHGIRIEPWACPNGAQHIQARLWDFGGQEIMHATHQFFLSQRSLYVLVLDARTEEKQVEDYWLQLIESFGGTSKILVVLNKIDENPSFDLNRVDLRKKYPGIIGFYQVSCLTQKGIPQLIEAIKDALPSVELANSTWPETWFLVKQELETVTKDFIDYPAYEQLCQNHGVTAKDQRETLLAYLNDLGVALHFPNLGWYKTQVLNPAWITKPVYELINNARLAQNQGILLKNDLPEYLPAFPLERLPFLGGLLVEFKICFPLDEQTLLFPNLLPVGEPETLNFTATGALHFSLGYDFLPRSIFPRLMVAMYKDHRKGCQWRTGMLLHHPELASQALIKVDYDKKRITFQVTGDSPREYLAVLLKHIREIHASFQKIGAKELVRCICTVCQTKEPAYEFSYEVLLRRHKNGKSTTPCEYSDEEVSIKKLLTGTYGPKEIDDPLEQRLDFFGDAKNLPGKPGDPKGTPSDEQLCWIHLSDLHMNPDQKGWKTQPVLESLTQKMKDFCKEKRLKPQLLFFTGDLADGERTGGDLAKQYKALFEYLDTFHTTLDIPKNQVFLVPGNHDVNRKKVSDSQKALLTSLNEQGHQALSKVEGYISNNTLEWKEFMARLQDYFTAVKAWHPGLYACQPADERDKGPAEQNPGPRDYPQGVYHHVIDLRGFKLGVFGFNGAWSCAEDGESGRLWLGAKWQIELAKEKLKKADLRFGLIHHPPAWYNQAEAAILKGRLENTFDLFLHGHEHDTWVDERKYKEGTHLRIAAGATFGDTPGEFGVNIGVLDPATREGGIYLFTYSDQGATGWIPKPIPGHNDHEGYRPFSLARPKN